jgi:hypothetical protein
MATELEKYRQLARYLVQTRPVELTCDEWLDHVGLYAEHALAGTPAPASLDLVREHLELCPECDEEFRAILEALRDEG